MGNISSEYIHKYRTYIMRLGNFIYRYFRFPFYPFLFAVYVPIWLTSNNFDLFQLSDAYRALLVSFLLAFIGVVILKLIYANTHKAAFVTAIGFLCLYGFAPMRQAFSILGVRAPGETALIVLLTAFPLIGIITYWLSFPRETASKILNGFAIALLILPIGALAESELYNLGKRQNALINPMSAQLKTRGKPSVVHIVLDGYSSTDTLKQLYELDNTEFIVSLRKLGFTVADRATSAYNQTMLSMSSVFSMEYINEKMSPLSNAEASEKEIRVRLHWDFQEAPVLKRFRSMGYKIVDVENLYWGMQLEHPDIVISSNQIKFGLSHFETVLIQYTPIYKVIDGLNIVDQKYEKVKFSLENHDVGYLDRPYFIYNHILAPHPPFNISADGEFRASKGGFGEGEDRTEKSASEYANYQDGYVEKLKYVNKQVLKKAKSLIASLPDPKVIIIHGDHGGGLYYDQNSMARTCLRERFTTLLAVYASADIPLLKIDDDTNLVNLYREIFTQAFGLAFETLPSRHYYATWRNPGNLIPVPRQALTTFGPVCAPDGIR